MTPEYDNEAIHMLTRAEITPKPAEVRVLANDLVAVADELYPSLSNAAAAYQAASALRQRIGGYQNLRGYVDCLLINGFDSDGWHECPLEEDLDCEPYDNYVEMRLEESE